MVPQPADGPVATCAADHLEINTGFSADTPNNRRHLLAPLSLDALDQVRAALLTEQGVFTVVPGPHAAPGGIDQLMGAADHCACRQFGQPVFTARQNIRPQSWPAQRGRGIFGLADPRRLDPRRSLRSSGS